MIYQICSRLRAGLLALSGLALLAPSLVAGAELPEKYQYIQDAFPDVEITSVQPSPIPGFLEMSLGAELFYVTDDAKYFIRGDIFEVKSRANITEASRSAARGKYLAQIDPESTILFAAEDSQYTVTVFTDIDCGYCRKLHREMADYNEAGISVRYVFFPRSGPGTPSWEKAEQVWCSDSRQDAMTRAKSNLPLQAKDCGTTPIAAHYEIVGELGLRGTPAIFTEKGQHVMGYMAADELLEILENES